MNITTFQGLLAFLSCLILASPIFITSFERKANKLFVALSLAIGFWCLTPFLANLFIDYKIALLIQRIGYVFGILFIPLFVEFVSEITNRKVNKNLRRLYFFLTFILIYFLPTKFFIADLVIFHGFRQSKPAFFYHIFTFMILSLVLLCLYLLLTEAKKSTGIKQKQLKLVFFAYLIWYCGGFFYFGTIYQIIPLWTQAGYFIIVGTTLLCYAMLHYQFLEIESNYNIRLSDFKQEHQNATLNIAKHLIEIRELDRLSKQVLTLIRRVTNFESASFYIFEKKKFVLYADVKQNSFTEITDNSFISFICERKEMLFKKDIDRWASEIKTEQIKKVAKFLHSLDFTLIIPLVFERVIAVILLKEKEPLNLEQLNNLSLIVYSASLTLQNINLNSRVIRDSLTGLYNRDYFDEQMKNTIACSISLRQPVSFALLDIDYFKKLNDTHGHLFGDEAIKLVSNALESSLRPADIISRWGGDEFGIIIKDSSRVCLKALERLRESISQMKIKNMIITVSIGITEFLPASCGEIEDAEIIKERLMKESDKALYSAKQKRNSIFIFGGFNEKNIDNN